MVLQIELVQIEVQTLVKVVSHRQSDMVIRPWNVDPAHSQDGAAVGLTAHAENVFGHSRVLGWCENHIGIVLKPEAAISLIAAPYPAFDHLEKCRSLVTQGGLGAGVDDVGEMFLCG